jgi:hypothetical protein
MRVFRPRSQGRRGRAAKWNGSNAPGALGGSRRRRSRTKPHRPPHNLPNIRAEAELCLARVCEMQALSRVGVWHGKVDLVSFNLGGCLEMREAAAGLASRGCVPVGERAPVSLANDNELMSFRPTGGDTAESTSYRSRPSTITGPRSCRARCLTGHRRCIVGGKSPHYITQSGALIRRAFA